MASLTLTSAALTAAATLCTTTLVPASGYVTMDNGPASVTLAKAIVYQVPCPTAKPLNAMALISPEGSGDSSLKFHDPHPDPRVSDFRDPFYASTFPICYALAATTVTSYMLLIMLFVTPRSFLDGGVVYLGRRRGFTHTSAGAENIGGRPWLQKVATLTVAVSLTIATHDTFKIAQRQYQWGAQNATVMQQGVMGSTEIRVIRLISNTFLWLAQAQTLIRLFPRHREKVIIKWAAFALITLDLIFSALTSFKDNDNSINPMAGSFDHPIPALSYLFQLLLGVLYAAWVIYYSLMKKRYAFYHPLMKNMPLLAIISLSSILIPVVFFIVDISKPALASWGDYVRWVGAAAASVIVWEWVERIEALEREEKKDGILGREVFDGEETLEVNASEFPWLRHRKHHKDDRGGGGGGGANGANGDASWNAGTQNGNATSRDHGILRGGGWPGVSVAAGRQRSHTREPRRSADQPAQQRTTGGILRPPLWPSRPAPAVTPVSRTDTPSAASTVYAVRYQGTSDATNRTPDLPTRTPDPSPPHQSIADLSRQNSSPQNQAVGDDSNGAMATQNGHVMSSAPPPPPPPPPPPHPLRANRFVDLEANSPAPSRSGRRRAQTLTSHGDDDSQPDMARQVPDSPIRVREETGRWDFKSRLEMFAANQADKMRERLRPSTETVDLPTQYIPAPPRRGAALQQVLEEGELSSSSLSHSRTGEGHSNGSSGRRGAGSDEMAQLGRQDSSTMSGSLGRTAGANPPLWPGVRRRVPTFEDDDDVYSYDDEDEGSLTETASMESERRDSDDEVGGHVRAAGAEPGTRRGW
ncbi:pH-response regulator protein palH/rim21 [Purpureocillium takamizusanense]|uniref:PH-response regulator protein palH/rim21 n=1 Tax=Purpureocillium takamizusanense TaxID=2060973 RepID=A0A9Q8QKH1_9HYPO|nr:pH-response regulator protein palH/rim21 [Purpureocillium takamizusanense]UNI21413.1 pH-response regulator protein palH/rim21 [Purpureocillium takamizusanense]